MEVAPDVLAGGRVEARVVQGDVDAGLKGDVEGGDAVGGEDDDAGVVLEGAEEDCRLSLCVLRGQRYFNGNGLIRDNFVADEVAVSSLLEEDVAFVEQQDGFPLGCEVEDAL